MSDVKKWWALSVPARAQTLWDSGMHPDTEEKKRLFSSCASFPGIGTFLAMAVQTGLTPNGKFYRGEGRRDVLVWGEAGCPVPQPARVRSGRPSRRAQAKASREFYRAHGLFKPLLCGCMEECPGAAWHARVEAAEEARERELREQHAAWDLRRELALKEAQREFADELARATLNSSTEPADDLDPEAAADFASIRVPDGTS